MKNMYNPHNQKLWVKMMKFFNEASFIYLFIYKNMIMDFYFNHQKKLYIIQYFFMIN